MSDLLDRELTWLPEMERWRTWMGRVEATIFAAPEPVRREVLEGLIGAGVDLDSLLRDIEVELQARPYEIVQVAGGFQLRTRPEFAGAIRASNVLGPPRPELSQRELTVLMAIAYFQPITRADLSTILGKSISRDVIAHLAKRGYVAAGHRSPLPGAPYSYVTTAHFLQAFGFNSLKDLPDMEKLTEAGLLDRSRLWADPDPASAIYISDAEEHGVVS